MRWRGEGLEVRLGRQVITWGKGDRINPTDMFAARDWRRLTLDDDDNRLGLLTASLAIDIGDGRLTALWLPEFRATTSPVTIPGLMDREPDSQIAQGALRYDASTNGIDWSVSASSIIDRMPTLALAPSASGFALEGAHLRRLTLGADTAFTVGDLNMRVEGAAYLGNGDPEPGGRYIPRLFVTVGADRDVDGWNINGQVLLKVNNERSPTLASSPLVPQLAITNDLLQGSWSESLSGAAVRVRRGFLNDTASAELTFTTLQRGGRSLEAKMFWSPIDGWRLALGGRYFMGDDNTFFGSQRARGGAFVEARYGF